MADEKSKQLNPVAEFRNLHRPQVNWLVFRRLHRAVAVIVWLVCCTANARAADPAAVPDFERDVRPILRSHCLRCHGPKQQQAKVRFDTLSTNLATDRDAAQTWREALNMLNLGEMPPEDELPLEPGQRKVLTGWIEDAIERAIAEQRSTGGRVVLRRLNRSEYQHTMTELLGLEMDYVRDLPPEPTSPDGFLNNGRSLRMSSIQLEYYLQAARQALQRVIVEGPPPTVYHHHFGASNQHKWLGALESSKYLGRSQKFLGKMVDDYVEEGEFLIRVKASADLREDRGAPQLEVAVGFRPDTFVMFKVVEVVEVDSLEPNVYEFRGRLENYPLPVRGQGKFPGLVVRVRNVYDDGSPLPKPENKEKKRSKVTVFPPEPHLPQLIVHSVDFTAPVYDRWPPRLHRRILFESKLRAEDEREYVRQVLQRFMTRAWRRPVKAAEVARMLAFYESIRPDYESLEKAIRETLAMVLIRPEFLYLMEPAGDEKRPLNQWELASRLSYFLWSTMPDERLLQRAAAGQLDDPDVLVEEIDRLLEDDRSMRFVTQFTDQWLKLDMADRVAISQEYYPDFNESLKTHMRAETHQFFRQLLRQDLSAANLLDSSFTMLNEPLARHYGIGGVRGLGFQRVEMKPDQNRGGLLAQASILMGNSTGEDSHAIRRAVWIRDRLLDDPPAPPPPNVPSLDEADPEFARLPVREQLKIHRNTEACASCHRGIDAWGIALENFDAVGLWRDQIRRRRGKQVELHPVVATDELPGGKRLEGFSDLKAHLLNKHRHDFARALCARLTSYALGRSLELSDEVEIDELTNEFVNQGMRLRPLLHRIVMSEMFQTK